MSRDGTTLYTANGGSNDVSIIDAAARRVRSTVKVGARPWGVALVR
jgi:YVTN family beta-propeller protein